MVVPSAESVKLESSVDVASPCVGICQYTPGTDVCSGCGRTSDEITKWMFLSSSEKQQIIDRLF